MAPVVAGRGGAAVLAEEIPAFNDLVARTFIIEVQPLVERFCGQALEGLPKFKLVTREEYCRIMSEDFVAPLRKQEPQLTEAQARELLVQPLRAQAVGLLGKYNFRTKAILLLPGNLKPMMRRLGVEPRYTRDLIEVIIAHEMTHAVQDAGSPLRGALMLTENEEEVRAYSMLTEGHAMVIQERVAKELRLDEAATRLAMQMAEDGGWTKYLEGKKFVEVMMAKGGIPLMKLLLMDPPRSTAAMRDPEAFLVSKIRAMKGR